VHQAQAKALSEGITLTCYNTETGSTDPVTGNWNHGRLEFFCCEGRSTGSTPSSPCTWNIRAQEKTPGIWTLVEARFDHDHDVWDLIVPTKSPPSSATASPRTRQDSPFEPRLVPTNLSNPTSKRKAECANKLANDRADRQTTTDTLVVRTATSSQKTEQDVPLLVDNHTSYQLQQSPFEDTSQDHAHDSKLQLRTPRKIGIDRPQDSVIDVVPNDDMASGPEHLDEKDQLNMRKIPRRQEVNNLQRGDNLSSASLPNH